MTRATRSQRGRAIGLLAVVLLSVIGVWLGVSGWELGPFVAGLVE